jgi:hypothetical protein
MIKKVKYQEYLQTPDSFQVSSNTFKRYIDLGVIPGERIVTGTYYAHIENERVPDDNLKNTMLRG